METSPKVKNRFNGLTSKEWLPFQKSWFRFESVEKLYRDNLRFFTRAAPSDASVAYYGKHELLTNKICDSLHLIFSCVRPQKNKIQFCIIDLLDEISENISLDEYLKISDKIIQYCCDVYCHLEHRRFVAVFIPNVQVKNVYFPFAWDLGKQLSSIFSIKDEKIACFEEKETSTSADYFKPSRKFFYCLYFRKDELSSGKYSEHRSNFFNNTQQSGRDFGNHIPSWFILKPQPRKKDEIQHPAKYPEDLVTMFIHEFSNEGDNVFDPMSGTASTQISALRLNRNGYGTELSEFFSGIANRRCTEYIASLHNSSSAFKILNKDARAITKKDFPAIDYMITSPPYWDMLNMKGAENQAKRLEKGLQTSYSDDSQDLGNISDYNDFIHELTNIYINVISLMKPGSYFTIVVKNIKKKGRNFPFAWDLVSALQEKAILLPEVFWCQDDISIAPYGYGNTWVSNTFHQYCLTFEVI